MHVQEGRERGGWGEGVRETVKEVGGGSKRDSERGWGGGGGGRK